jgi:DNA topoisomerase IB
LSDQTRRPLSPISSGGDQARQLVCLIRCMRRRLPVAWRRLQPSSRDDRSLRLARHRRLRATTLSTGAQTAPSTSAQTAGLRYVCNRTIAGIWRVGRKGCFRYVAPDGHPVRPADLRRIRHLAIPPAWTDVWICPNPERHLQATGRDARGRKQYRYHPKWRAVRDDVKYGRLIAFAQALPLIRRQVERDMSAKCLMRTKVLAIVVLPTLEQHLRLAQNANSAVGTSGKK